MAEDQSEFLASLPENIGDIDDEATLIKVLEGIYRCDETFTIHSNFIYMHTYCRCNEYQDENLFTISFEDVQCMYQYYKRGLTNRYRLKFQNTKICGREYFMFKGKFTIVSLGGIYEENDLIFHTKDYANYITLTEKYYSVPDYIKEGAVELYTPIKSVFKFNKYAKASGEKYFSTDKHYRHATDPYDTRVSFMCADTFDIVNPETGERVKTWKLKIISKNTWEIVKETIDTMSYTFSETINIRPDVIVKLLLNEKWNQCYLLDNNKNFYELRHIDSGRATKAAAMAAE
jgi:hypothetical protein